MNIAFDAKRYFNNGTGLGFYSRTLVNDLRRFYPEHRYMLYSPYDRGRFRRGDEELHLPDSRLSRIFHPMWRSKWIVKQLRKDGAQVFHGLSHELPTGLKKAGIRSVVTMHDLIFLRYPDLYPAIDRFFYKQKYKKAATEADVVVAISEQTRSDLETYFNIPSGSIKVIGQSCDESFRRLSLYDAPDINAYPLPCPVPESDFLIAVGSLTPRKNWHRLIDALALLKGSGQEIPLLAVGSGSSAYALGLHEQAARLNVPVIWINRHLTSSELAGLYRRAAALVYPSIFEGFGIPILEALSVGIPVVSSKGGCFAEVGGQAALYADPFSTEDIARQISLVLEPSVREGLLAAAPDQARAFEPQEICRAWMEVYTG